MALPTNQEIDNAIRTSNTGTDADRPIRSSTNELLKAFRQEIANTQQDLANKVNNSSFNALADVARTGNYNDINGRPQQYGGTGQNTDGYMTQKAVTDALGDKADLVGGKVPFEQLPSSLASGVVFKGTWNAATNQDNSGNPLPATPVADGEYYIVNTAGTQFSLTFAAGDWIIAVDGQWYKLEPDSTVSSVNGQTGAVVIDVGVTSVGVTVPTGLVVANTPVTSAGTIDIELDAGYKIPTEAELTDRGIEPPNGWLEAGNETKYLAGDGTLKDIPSDTQSDYAQTNPNAPDYIKNKPALFSGSYDDLGDKPSIPTKTSELTNDSEFITDASLADLNEKVDAALTKTFSPWQPDVIEGTGIDESKYPENPEGKGYEIIGLTQPAQWDALGKEVKNSDFIVFDNAGVPKTLGEDVDLSGYATTASVSEGLNTKVTKPEGFNLESGDTAKYLSGKGTLEKAAPVSQNDDAQYVQVNGNLHNISTIEFAQILPSSTDLFSLKKGIYKLSAVRTYVNSPPLPAVSGETYKLIVIGDSYVDSYAGKTVCSAIVVGNGIFYYTDPSQYYGTTWRSAASFVNVPASPTDTGAKGQIAADADYIYYCYSPNNWISVPKKEFLDNKVDKIQDKEIVTADKTLTAADSGKLLIINEDGITITMPANSDFNIDIAKMDKEFVTIVQCDGTDNFREETDTISVIRDVSITNSGIVGKEWLAIGAYEV